MEFSFDNGILMVGDVAVEIGIEAVLALVFLALVLAVYGLAGASQRTAAQRRLQGELAGVGRVGRADQREGLRYEEENVGWLGFLKPIYIIFTPKSGDRLATVRKDLIYAGYMGPSAVSIYFAAKVGMGIVFGIATAIALPLLFAGIAIQGLIFGAVLGMLIGYLLPTYFVSSRAGARKKQIRNGFPDALDLMLVCVEAGLGIDAAIARVGVEIEDVHPVLSEHFRMVGVELRAGRSRPEAMRAFADRTGVEDISAFVSLLIQSDELGTSIAHALNVHASEMRAKRMSRAEEKAHKVPTKLAFPLMFGLIPVLLIVTLAPAIFSMSEMFNVLKTGSASSMENLKEN
jgi:tight adherence protein C